MKNKKYKLVDLNLVVPVQDIKIFLGQYNGFQRYDIIKYPFAKQIEQNMRQAFWTPEEINLVSDRQKFESLPFQAQEAIISNLLFQTLMDSAQNRGLDTVLSNLVTSSEWEAVFKTQAFFELIHSLSYSHIIREMFSNNASDIFDRIYKINEIKHRTDNEIKIYSEIKEYLDGKHSDWNEATTKKKILELLINIYFLEGLKFYVSFMVTYLINFSYDDAISGISRIIKLINFDEDMHVSVIAGLLQILKINPHEGFSELMASEWYTSKVYQILEEVVEQEIEWGNYLTSFGAIPSLTINVIKYFMQYYANNRLEKIGMEPLYKGIKRTDLIDWFEIYKDINKDNTAQQESTALNYNIGHLKNDLEQYNLEQILNLIDNDWNKSN